MYSRIILVSILSILSVVTIISGFLAFNSIGITTPFIPGLHHSLADGTSKSYSLNDFTKLEFKTNGTLNIVKGSKNELNIEANKEYIDRLQPIQVGNKITIEQPKISLKFWQNISDVTYTLTYKGQLDEIISQGSGDISNNDLNSSNLTVAVFGSGDVTLHNAKIDQFNSNIIGSGNIKVDGECGTQNSQITGSGDMFSPRFKCSQGEINIKGSGNSRVNIADKLRIKINGSGNINYVGSPQITSDINGSGKVKQVNE